MVEGGGACDIACFLYFDFWEKIDRKIKMLTGRNAGKELGYADEKINKMS